MRHGKKERKQQNLFSNPLEFVVDVLVLLIDKQIKKQVAAGFGLPVFCFQLLVLVWFTRGVSPISSPYEICLGCFWIQLQL